MMSMQTRNSRKRSANLHAESVGNAKKLKKCETLATVTEKKTVLAEHFFDAVAPRNVCEDLGSEEAAKCIRDGLFPASCPLTRELGIDMNDLYILDGRAYSRSNLCQWIATFQWKSQMPSSPINRQEIDHAHLRQLGFELDYFRAHRLAQEQLRNFQMNRTTVGGGGDSATLLSPLITRGGQSDEDNSAQEQQQRQPQQQQQLQNKHDSLSQALYRLWREGSSSSSNNSSSSSSTVSTVSVMLTPSVVGQLLADKTEQQQLQLLNLALRWLMSGNLQYMQAVAAALCNEKTFSFDAVFAAAVQTRCREMIEHLLDSADFQSTVDNSSSSSSHSFCSSVAHGLVFGMFSDEQLKNSVVLKQVLTRHFDSLVLFAAYYSHSDLLLLLHDYDAKRFDWPTLLQLLLSAEPQRIDCALLNNQNCQLQQHCYKIGGSQSSRRCAFALISARSDSFSASVGVQQQQQLLRLAASCGNTRLVLLLVDLMAPKIDVLFDNWIVLLDAATCGKNAAKVLDALFDKLSTLSSWHSATTNSADCWRSLFSDTAFHNNEAVLRVLWQHYWREHPHYNSTVTVSEVLHNDVGPHRTSSNSTSNNSTGSDSTSGSGNIVAQIMSRDQWRSVLLSVAHYNVAQGYTLEPIRSFYTGQMVTISRFAAIGFGDIFETLLVDTMCDPTSRAIESLLYTMLDVAFLQPKQNIYGSALPQMSERVTLLLFDCAAKGNSLRIFEALLRLHEDFSTFSNDFVQEVLMVFARHDRLLMLQRFESAAVDCEKLLREDALEDLLHLAIEWQANGVAFWLYDFLTAWADKEQAQQHVQKNTNDSSNEKQQRHVAERESTTCESDNQNDGHKTVERTFGCLLYGAVEHENGMFLKHKFRDAAERISEMDRRSIVEVAVQRGSPHVLSVLLRPDFLAVDRIEHWAELLTSVPLGQAWMHKAIWNAGQQKFRGAFESCKNMRTASSSSSTTSWHKTCNVVLQALLWDCRHSCIYGMTAWLHSLPPEIFAEHYDAMLMAACQKDSKQARAAFRLLVSTASNTFHNDFNYFFRGGQLLRRASAVDSPIVAKFMLQRDKCAMGKAVLGTLYADCLLLCMHNSARGAFDVLLEHVCTEKKSLPESMREKLLFTAHTADEKSTTSSFYPALMAKFS